ncbi:MlaD family protein [Marinilabilia rubra]|uniref:MCE family protein n=1 Tax=Marinilabilia rubra TaxID=2162893 RepID=A0A2U2BA86_9BACT|nr:MlaD family protein [Marinilabilia rubra]PWD99977.1 MCE family protein [Marinilabilia rubra]
MIDIKKEYKIAVTVVVALLVLLWGVNFLKGKNLFESGFAYYGVYHKVAGLTEASPVYYHGYKIGSVREIQFNPQKEDRFLVTLSLNDDFPVYEDMVAQIYSLDLMGTKAVQFLDGENQQLLSHGDTLRTDVMGGLKDQVTTEVLPVKDKVENLIVKLDTTLTNLSKVFSNKNNRSLEEGMESFRDMMQNLDETTSEINSSLKKGGAIHNSLANLDSISGELNRQRQAIGTTMENVADFSHQLKAMNLDTVAGRIDSSLIAINTLLKQTRDGEGSLGLLLSDEGLYYNLMDASASLDRLLADVRHNPKRYLSFSAVDFGRDVYVNVDDEKAEQQGIVYKVKIAESKEPLTIRNQMVKDQFRIFEDSDGEKYIYTVGATSSYGKIEKILKEVIGVYPDASIIALKNGKPIKVVKALKQTGRKN